MKKDDLVASADALAKQKQKNREEPKDGPRRTHPKPPRRGRTIRTFLAITHPDD